MSSFEAVSAWGVFLFLLYLEICKEGIREAERSGKYERVISHQLFR